MVINIEVRIINIGFHIMNNNTKTQKHVVREREK